MSRATAREIARALAALLVAATLGTLALLVAGCAAPTWRDGRAVWQTAPAPPRANLRLDN